MGSRTHPLLVTTAHIDELREKCESLASEAKDGAVVESKDFAQSLVDEQLDLMQQHLEGKLQALEERINSSLAEVQARLEGALSVAQAAAPKTELAALRAELRGGVAEAAAAAGKETEARSALSSLVEALRAETSKTTSSLTSLGARQRDEGQRRVADFEALRKSILGEVDERCIGLEDAIKQVRVNIGGRVEAIENSHLETLEARFTDVASRLRTLELDARGIESIPTRRVEWLIRDASKLDHSARTTQKVNTASRSWWSPKFMAAGQGELQLELRVFREGGSDRGGNCQLHLWGCDGCRGFEAVVKLYVGKTVEELQHTFAPGRPCTMRHCLWQSAVSLDDDTLRVGMEVVEGFQLFSSSCESTASMAPPGSLSLYRHLCPGTADRVACLQEQWDGLRSRMVGRVEWRLEQVLMLQQCFPKGESLCSAMFSAGGFEHLQLVFYPSGDDDARACYCSFFLFCPGHSMLQCWLSVGKQRREAHRLRCRPDFTGRSNFCLFEGCTDRGNDTLVLALDIAEAHQHGGDSSKPTPKAVPWPALASPSPVDSDAGQDAGGPEAYEEVIQNSAKLQGVPGRISLEDVKQLPAVWTSKPGGGIAGAVAATQVLPPVWTYKPPSIANRGKLPDGFMKFADIPGAASVVRKSRPREAHAPRGNDGKISKSLPPRTPRPGKGPSTTPTVPVVSVSMAEPTGAT